MIFWNFGENPKNAFLDWGVAAILGGSGHKKEIALTLFQEHPSIAAREILLQSRETVLRNQETVLRNGELFCRSRLSEPL